MRINADQVRHMHAIGISRQNIANRLGCSLRQVCRILNGLETAGSTNIDGLLNTEYERVLWAGFFEKIKSYSRVAFLFGVTRQAVFQALNQQGEFHAENCNEHF